MRRRIAILGSTGSVGCSALRLIGEMPDMFEVVGLTTNVNISLLEEQVDKWRPRIIAVVDEKKCSELVSAINCQETKVVPGLDGIVEVATFKDVDVVLSATVGASGLMPIMSAIKAGKQLAVATKEPVVIAGKLLMDEVEKRGTVLIPVDSEPNAIFQCLEGRKKESVKRIFITASGGPFRKISKEEMAKVTPEEALAHPVWKMGRKISVDSATMINKGLEVIEAHNLFGIPFSSIHVLIHPEAKIHSMVEFIDGTVLAVMGVTDMRIPIQHALTYPERVPTPLEPINLFEIPALTFQSPDLDKFPGLRYGYDAGRAGGTMPAILNAANEVAVEAFLERKIGFLDITSLCHQVMEKHDAKPDPDLEEILDADHWARDEARKVLDQ